MNSQCLVTAAWACAPAVLLAHPVAQGATTLSLTGAGEIRIRPAQ